MPAHVRVRCRLWKLGGILGLSLVNCLLTPGSFPEIHPDPLPLSGRVQPRETLLRLFGRLGLPAEDRHRFVEAATLAWDVNRLREGSRYTTEWDREGLLRRFEYEIDEESRLVVTRTQDGLEAKREAIALEVTEAGLAAEVETSLWDAVVSADASPELALLFAEIFEADVDFQSDLRHGDRVWMIYEERMRDGMRVGSGRILAAKLSVDGRESAAIYFEYDDRGGYYTPDGRALEKALLRSPLRYRYISSGFTYRRLHPILRIYRPHRGIDYAAPAGTPVASVGDGRVVFAGWKGESGRLVIIAHPQQVRSYYSHLSGFAPGIRAGVRIGQGQVVGYVGSTGLSTGPHLDYRLQIRGRFVDPLTSPNVEGPPVPEEQRAAFLGLAGRMVERLARLTSPETDHVTRQPGEPPNPDKGG